jgi:hypothetical protein
MVSCENAERVRASLPVILLEDRVGDRESQLPEGVDAVVPMSSPTDLRNKLDEHQKGGNARRRRVNPRVSVANLQISLPQTDS